MLTHLDEDLQFQWLRELHRVAAPGAVVVLTVHTDYRAVRTLSQSAFAKYRRRGFFYQRAASDDKTVAGLPDFYQVAFHTRNYIAGKWTRLFEPLLSVAHGPFWSQQAIVLRKRDRTTPRLLKPRWKHVKLPLGGMDTPTFGGPPQGDIQHVAGWAFDPDSDERRNVTAWVNGKPAEMRCIEVERDDVKAAFPDIPHAGNAGFMLNVELPANDHGFHVIWFTAGDSPVPVSATYVTG